MRVLAEEESDEEEESEEEEDELREMERPQLPPGKNEMLTVGYKGDRSFVVRGNNIGVFSHKGTGEVGYVGTIKNVATPKGKNFKPTEVSTIGVCSCRVELKRSLFIGHASRARQQDGAYEPGRS